MSLTDQQLRQELLKYGETVPPITQRNREQLRDRLEYLRSRNKSPIRTRARPGKGLIELSDSETDASPNDYNGKRTNFQTRSIQIGRDSKPSTTASSDVEESIARHRREIQQLIDSARDRTRAANANLSSTSTSTPTTTNSRPSTTHRSRLAAYEKTKQPSSFHQIQKSVETYWNNYKNVILDVIKALLVGALLGAVLIFLKTKGGDLIPQRKGITCSIDNATECDDMIPIINSVRKFLRTRTGEVDCGFRQKDELFVSKSEINKHLDEKGFKFELGPEARWKTLVSYIFDKPVEDIMVFNNKNEQVQIIENASKLSATEGIHSMICRARKSINSAMHHLAWLLLGTTGFLSLLWFYNRRSKQQEENEKTYKNFLEKILNLLENQYEEHLNNPETKPWLAISHIRDMLIPPQDRQRLKSLWERARKQISESESRVRSESQLIHGEEYDVWRWIQPRSSSPSPQGRKRAESPHSSHEQSYVYMPSDVGLTECLKLRNFFDSDSVADDDEIDLVVDNIQKRCATVRRIEHIGIHSSYVYLKFSSKEAAAQGFHLLNDWKYHGREIVAKYLRLERYYEHFPEARNTN